MVAVRKWLIEQRWERMLFAHWRADADALRPHLPPRVELDTYDGDAWLGLVAFVMCGTRLALPPHGPPLPPIPELNVRTYVRVDGVPGVWFITLDASSPLFVSVGRAAYGLRYRLAKMATVANGDTTHFVSSSGFAAAYEPAGPPRPADDGSLEHFLVELYRLFAARRGAHVAADVAHAPWGLQPAAARDELNRVAPPGVELGAEPLAHYCPSMPAMISPPMAVSAPGILPRASTRATPARSLG